MKKTDEVEEAKRLEKLRREMEEFEEGFRMEYILFLLLLMNLGIKLKEMSSFVEKKVLVRKI
ncbi:hypothetical protein ACT7DP_17005 [Bacillus paranthracis]